MAEIAISLTSVQRHSKKPHNAAEPCTSDRGKSNK